MDQNDREKKKTRGDTVKLILLWGFVGIPILWGLIQTFHKALGLFR